MSAFASLLSFTLFTTCLALPPATTVNPVSRCLFPNDTGFSITAVNTTLPNSNTTGVPLVFYLTGEEEDYKSSYLVTWATSYWNEYPEPVQLVNGTITAHYDGQVATDGGSITPGDPLLFVESAFSDPPTQAWCEDIGTSPEGSNPPFPVLSVFGNSSSFALCSQVIAGSTRNIVVYEPADGGSYDFSSCYGVQLQAVHAAAPI